MKITENRIQTRIDNKKSTVENDSKIRIIILIKVNAEKMTKLLNENNCQLYIELQHQKSILCL